MLIGAIYKKSPSYVNNFRIRSYTLFQKIDLSMTLYASVHYKSPREQWYYQMFLPTEPCLLGAHTAEGVTREDRISSEQENTPYQCSLVVQTGDAKRSSRISLLGSSSFSGTTGFGFVEVTESPCVI